MGETLNTLALTAKQDEEAREKLIKSSRQTILRSASSAARRYITENDDEWSIAMYAFSKAVDAYSPDKGDFLARKNGKRDVIENLPVTYCFGYSRNRKHIVADLSVGLESHEGESSG